MGYFLKLLKKVSFVFRIQFLEYFLGCHLLKFSSLSSISLTSLRVSYSNFSTWTEWASTSRPSKEWCFPGPAEPNLTNHREMRGSPCTVGPVQGTRAESSPARQHSRSKHYTLQVGPQAPAGWPTSQDYTFHAFVLGFHRGKQFPLLGVPASHWGLERMLPVPALSPGGVRKAGGLNALPGCIVGSPAFIQRGI